MGDYLELKLAEIRMDERRREAAAARLVEQIKVNRRADLQASKCEFDDRCGSG